jgi:hypothetical protein
MQLLKPSVGFVCDQSSRYRLRAAQGTFHSRSAPTGRHALRKQFSLSEHHLWQAVFEFSLLPSRIHARPQTVGRLSQRLPLVYYRQLDKR